MTSDDTIDWNKVPPAQMLHIAMQEVADTYRELSQKIDGVTSGLKDLQVEIKKDMVDLKKELKSDIHTLRLEVHQNQTAFMRNQDSLEDRVMVLEMAA